MNKCACIAARDEQETIGDLIRTLQQAGYWVIVTNDASTDQTGFIARELKACVIWHIWREGIAQSLLQAWRMALLLRCDRIVQLDAGGSHDPVEADNLVEMLDGADVVIGSRFTEFGRYNDGKRWILSRLATAMCNFVGGTNFTDWTSGYRAFRAEALKTLLEQEYRARMHGWQMEVLWRAKGLGLRIAECPITYRAGRSTLSHGAMIEAFRIWLRILKSQLQS